MIILNLFVFLLQKSNVKGWIVNMIIINEVMMEKQILKVVLYCVNSLVIFIVFEFLFFVNYYHVLYVYI